MKNFIIIISIPLITAVFLYILGNSFPPTQEVKAEIQIKAPISKVWLIITSWANQPRWRQDIKEVKILSPDQFSEYSKQGSHINFQILDREEPKRIELKMSGAVMGTYKAELSEESGMTIVKIIESITIQNPFQRLLNKFFFNLEDFANSYLSALKSYCEKSL